MMFSILALASTASAAYLASTTRYYDGQKGACGCGDDSGAFSWQAGISNGVYTAAGSQAFFDTDDATWCGGGCGKCYKLTSTGKSSCDSCGSGGVSGESIIVMVTNLCPYSGNEQWCPSVNETNQYGYRYHFDIQAESQVFGDNVVVEFEPVSCPSDASSKFETCECYGKLESDETPAGLVSDGGDSSASSGAAAPTTSSTSAAAGTTAVQGTTTAAVSTAKTETTAAETTLASSATSITSATSVNVAPSPSSSTTTFATSVASNPVAISSAVSSVHTTAVASVSTSAPIIETPSSAVATEQPQTSGAVSPTTSDVSISYSGTCAIRVRTTTVWV